MLSLGQRFHLQLVVCNSLIRLSEQPGLAVEDDERDKIELTKYHPHHSRPSPTPVHCSRSCVLKC